MFFKDWQGLLAVAVTALCAYPALILFLRLSGKRTLAKLSAFDLVVTVALGSTLSTVIVSRQPPLAEGLLALILLILLQFAVAQLSLHSARFRQLLKSEPRLLFADGQFLHQAMTEERITEDDLRGAARSRGAANLEEVRFIVLEPNGDLSVVRSDSMGALYDLQP